MLDEQNNEQKVEQNQEVTYSLPHDMRHPLEASSYYIDTYIPPPHGWTCFFCGETFLNVESAKDHFGATKDCKPGCTVKVQYGDERGLLMELRKAEALVNSWRETALLSAGRIEGLTERLIAYERASGGRSAHEIENWLHTVRGRETVIEKIIEAFRVVITPLTFERLMDATLPKVPGTSSAPIAPSIALPSVSIPQTYTSLTDKEAEDIHAEIQVELDDMHDKWRRQAAQSDR